MKTIILLLGVIGLSISNTLAQIDLTESEIHYKCSGRVEIQAGTNFSRMGSDYSDSESSRLRPGINLGINIYSETVTGFSFMPGIAFEQKGGNYIYDYGEYNEEFPEGLGQANLGYSSVSPLATTTAVNNSANQLQSNTTMSYLTFPLQVGYKPIKNHQQLRIITGLTPGFLIARNTENNNFGFESSESGTEDFRTFDLGLMIGASYMFTKQLGVNVFYDHGLVNTTTNEFSPAFYNRTVKLLLFYRINFNPFLASSWGK